MFVETAQGQDAGYCAYSEKLRAHPVITMTSSWKQKHSGTTYGAVITQPFLFAQLLGFNRWLSLQPTLLVANFQMAVIRHGGSEDHPGGCQLLSA
jgi:hypothetical protein